MNPLMIIRWEPLLLHQGDGVIKLGENNDGDLMNSFI